MPPHNKLTLDRAESEHVGWMSTQEYYEGVWKFILRDVPHVMLGTPILVKLTAMKNVSSLGISTANHKKCNKIANDLAKKLKSSKSKSMLVWPIGSLTENNYVHWNVFIYSEKTGVIQFDPDKTSISCHAPTYQFDEKITSIIRKQFAVSTDNYVQFASNRSCQVDYDGDDHFCQTWIVLFTDFYVHVDDALEKFRKFDFLIHGKRLLKAWMRCVYKNMKHGTTESWETYVLRTRPEFSSMFHYQHAHTNKFITESSASIKKLAVRENGSCWGALGSILVGKKRRQKTPIKKQPPKKKTKMNI